MAKKRLNGEGCLYRVKGRYYFRRISKDSAGKHVSIHFPAGVTLKEALEKIEKYRKSNGIGLSSDVVFSEWLSTWLNKYALNKAESTRRTYSIMINKHIAPGVGGLKLSELRPFHVADFFSRLIKTHSARTVNLCRSIIAAAVKQAINNDLMIKSPLHGVARQQIKPAKHKILSISDFRQLFERCLKSEYKFPCLLMLFAGLRRGEALGASWSGIDFEKKTITIKSQLVLSPCGATGLHPLKTTKSYRTVSLPDFVMQELLKVPIRGRFGLLYGGEIIKNPARLTNHVKRMAAELGIKGLTSHDLRHTHASMLLKGGVSLPSVSARLGHASVKTTGDIYAHELPNSEDSAVRAMEVIIKGCD